MPGSIFGIAPRPTSGQGVVWSETLGGRMDVGSVNAQTLLGSTWAEPGSIGSGTPAAGAFTTLSATGVITSTLATGTAPFTVASTTNVANLNASSLSGATFASPGAIGSGTPSTGAFTTLSATGVITSTLATGTAPFTVASTTVVANLNASALSGKTFADPGPIGSGTASTGAFTTLDSTGATTLVNSGTGRLLIGSSVDDAATRVQIRNAGTSALRCLNTSASASNGGGFIACGADDGAALASGDRIGGFFCFGSKDGASTYVNGASVVAFTTEAWSSTAAGSKLVFSVCPNGSGSRTDRLTIDQDGTIILGGALKLNNAYVATPPTCSGYVTIVDSGGTTYKVMVST